MSAAAGVEPDDLPQWPRSRHPRGTRHLAVVGDVSGIRALQLDAELQACATTVDRLIVNMSRVTHLSLAALRSLIRARTLIEAHHGSLDVHGVSPAAAQALARAGLCGWVTSTSTFRSRI